MAVPFSGVLNPHAALLSGSPYTGTAMILPGRIEVENYDNGGEGVAYHDTTTTNDGGAYRAEGVDVCTCGSPYGLSVGWTQPGEWMEYTVTVATYGTYKFQPLTATTVSGSALHVEVDGVNVTGQITLPNTGAWGTYAPTSSVPVTLSAGQHIVRVGIDVSGFLIDSVDVIRLNTPYGGTATAVPGTIPAENFDDGGEGIAYHDTTTANEGGAYRSEGVDLCACGNSEGAALGWSQVGEWTRYTVNVSTTDTYTLQARMSTIGTGCAIHLEVDGVNVTGQMVLPNTGSWDAWSTISKPNVQLSAGQHELKMVIEGAGFLLDSLSAIPSVAIAPSGLTANAVSTSQINLAWTDNSFNESEFKIERKTGPSGTYAEITTTAAGVTSFSDTGRQPSTQYFYRVRATNLGGDSTYSNEASAMTSNLLPSASVTAPSGGSVFTAPANFTINASASDSDGSISKVEFFAGASLLGEDLTAPYSFAWSNVSRGSYVLTAKATDNNGGVTTSAAVSAVVTDAPTTSITSPTNSAVLTAGSNIIISATASDDGTVAKVEFLKNGVVLGEDTSAPYSFAWNNIALGSYALTTRVTDELGVTATSNAVNVNVIGPTGISRLDPMNRTGGSGEDPLSRNFNWSLPLLNLPGRAGMDLSLSLSYNSLVWTRTGSYMSFDDDHGFPSPGFRLGFPVIQQQYFNSEVGKDAYLLIGTDGSRTELRRVGATALFEAADSSHLLLDTNTMVLRSTDGTQMTYSLVGMDFNCTQIKDRNGNYIAINYNASGQIDNIHDTLDRIITFNYDNGLLSSITQTWKKPSDQSQTITHTWASFAYADLQIQTNFNGLSVIGPANGSTKKVLSKVTLDDNSTTPAENSHFDFDYTSWGQVWKISNFAADNHLLNYRFYNLPQTAGTAQSDCPRFTERRDFAERWNENNNGIEQEAVMTFTSPQTGTATVPGQSSQSATVVQVTNPDQTFTKMYFLGTAGTSSGWRVGLPYLVESYDVNGSIPERQVVTTWTQDDETKSFIINPRVLETNIYDRFGKHKRTGLVYQSHDLGNGITCQLPQDVREYDVNATTILRTTRTIYIDDSPYLSRWILGLPKERLLYEGNADSGVLRSKQVFKYDDPQSIEGNDAPVQHDPAYSSAFVSGRGNLSSIERYNVDNLTQFTTILMKYNTAGAVVTSKDALNHETKVSYIDAFSDNVSRTTLAFPTKVTDPDGYYSTSKYNFDFGALTYRQTPPPNFNGPASQQPAGPEQSFEYYDHGRIKKELNLVNSAYTRFEYSSNGIRVDTYVTVEENQGEAHSFQIFDGARQMIASVTSHTGSEGGYAAQLIVYDIMGRVIKTSNPTETSALGNNPSQWTPAGDDIAWIYSEQTYDWKGRPLVTTNQDHTTRSASYIGCGCAGGEVVTLTDEGTVDSEGTKRRQQKIYSDILGRTVKTEILNWEGGSVYSTTVNTYNVRDQITQVRQYAGAEGSGTYQDTITAYDGYGRLQSRHVPEQDTGTATVWTYNADDTLNTVTDARGAVSTFGYAGTNRRLVKQITDTLSGSPTINTSFTYDADGNRLSMTDSLGSLSYAYNQLGQLTSETRTFADFGSFALSYRYNLAGELTNLTDPFGEQVGYGYDSVGRLNAITGAVSYASNLKYRASGALKSLTYGNSKTLSLGYDANLRVSTYEIPGLMKKSYQYYADSRLKFTQDQSMLNSKFDRLYKYDHLGRVTTALTGQEAQGGAATNDRPYNENMAYDAMGHLKLREVRQWDRYDTTGNETYINNRRQFWQYDADGRLLSGNANYSYDAAGQISSFDDAGESKTEQQVDGDGRRIRSEHKVYNLNTNQWTTDEIKYYIHSSVLGQLITELNAVNGEDRSFVYAGGKILAIVNLNGGSPQFTTWQHYDPSSSSYRATYSNGDGAGGAEMDPLGADAGLMKPFTWNPPTGPGKLEPYYGIPELNSASSGCILDGIQVPCSVITEENSRQCWDNQCRTFVSNPRTGQSGVVEFHASADGHEGYSPLGWMWTGTGYLGPHFSLSFVDGVPQQQQRTAAPLKPDSAELLRRARKIITEAKGCAELLTKLMSSAQEVTHRPPQATSVSNVLDAVEAQGGIVYGDTIKNYYKIFEGSTVHGSVKTGNAQIELPTPHDFVTFQPKAIHDRNAAQFAEQKAWDDAQALIHESFHLAGYSDRDMMNATAAANGVNAPDFSDLPPAERVLKESNYWTRSMEAVCQPVKN